MLRSGDTIVYDTLVLAPGARMLAAFEDVLTFGGPGSAAAMPCSRSSSRAALGGSPSWRRPSPGGRCRCTSSCSSRPSRVRFGLFGDRGSSAVAEMLGASHVEPVEGAIRLLPSGRMVPADRLVALPLLRGPRLDGVPSEPTFGFIPVDPHGRVDGLEGVYAAGDATNFPIKQGGLATQQADAVAEHVAIAYVAALSIDDRSPCGRPRYGGQRRGRGTCAARACRSTRSGR